MAVGGEDVQPAGVAIDFNVQRIYNPRQPIDPTDIVRLQDLTGYAAPAAAKYILQQPHASLPNAQALSVLATGVVMNTTTTGVLTSVAFTQGAIPFGAANGHLTQSAAALFWDNTFLRQGIGTNAPVAPLHVIVDSGAARGLRVGDATSTNYLDVIIGGVESRLDFVGGLPAKINHAGTTRWQITSGGDFRLDPATNFRIAAGSIRTDGLGSTGLIKNNNGANWTIAAAGTDYTGIITLTAGNGMVGGGNTSTNLIFDVATADGTITVNADSIQVGVIQTANIANSAVTNGKIRDSAGLSVIGRAANSTGAVADITGGSNGQILRIASSAIGWGDIVGTSVGGFTAGSVIFAGATGNLAQDNAGFFFDDLNNRLGIRNNSPQAPIHTVADGSTANAARFADSSNTNYVDFIMGGVELRLDVTAPSLAFKINHNATPRMTISGTGAITFAANSLFRVSTGSVQLDGIGATGIVYNTNGGNLSIAQGAAMSVTGRAANSTGVLADIAASSNGQVLRIAASTVGWGTITGASVAGFTAGSVIFAGSSGELTQDNASLFWNDTNNRLGIGTTGPADPLHVVADGGTARALRVADPSNVNYVTYVMGGVEFRFDIVAPSLPFKINHNSTTRMQITGTGDLRFDPAANTYISGGTIRTDGLGSTGLIKNTHGGNWSIAVAGTDYQSIITLTAGAGLTGGGTTATNRTFDVAAADGTITVNADSIQVGTVQTANYANDSVTYAKIQNVSAADRLLGRGNGGGSGDVQEISLGTHLSISGTTLSSSAENPLTFSNGLTRSGNLVQGDYITGLGSGSPHTWTASTVSGGQLTIRSSSNPSQGTLTLSASQVLMPADGTLSTSAPPLSFVGQTGMGIDCTSNGLYFVTNSNYWMNITSGAVNITNNAYLAINSIQMQDDGSEVLAIRNGTNDMSLRVYNTFTSSTNYERGVFDWITSSNVLTIGTQAGSGGGTLRATSFVGSQHTFSTGGTTSMIIDGAQKVAFRGTSGTNLSNTPAQHRVVWKLPIYQDNGPVLNLFEGGYYWVPFQIDGERSSTSWSSGAESSAIGYFPVYFRLSDFA